MLNIKTLNTPLFSTQLLVCLFIHNEVVRAFVKDKEEEAEAEKESTAEKKQ